ncbi:SIS domain-containing protein [Deinococcus yavapaiensis]|uniref:Glutamine--fructose-6-phosphate transaminase n=1 Tax=Deinococcus yavapaiensis KR-236 TaxID=694435 RepID=A0A318S995_9DEIO|nr:SIS domain-containing protein [Deinococcus yavapaiensis]PYE52777.1 glutamine--fructose-6-phosphate transaminase [Deinococcus yavapaiensis KR-236]
MSNPDPWMLREAREIPDVTARQLERQEAVIQRLADIVRERSPRFVVTIARGASDHAATFLKYSIETHLGLPVSAAAPSVTTVYRRALKLDGALVIAVSQSGASPDVVEPLQAARHAGATTLAIVNVEDSPLARAAEFVLPMYAAEERAVTATKSYVASLTAGLNLLSHLQPDASLRGALTRLPDVLRDALALEEHARDRAERYRFATSMMILARGLHFGVALESALKLKETSGVLAEAYSSAEFAHGPTRVIEAGFPVVAFQSRDAAAPLTLAAYEQLIEKGAELLLIGDDVPLPSPVRLVTPPSGHPLTDPLASVLALYFFAAHLALARGLDPDSPPSLQKVTLTR